MRIANIFQIMTAAVLLTTVGAEYAAAQSFTLPRAKTTLMQEGEMRPPDSTTWKLSVAALTAANMLDLTSSWGKCEQNASLRTADGRFDGSRAILLKAGVLGGLVATEWLLTRKTNRYRKAATIFNFGAAGAIGAVAAHNYTNRAPSQTGQCR